jgi:hypothetical protein
MSRKNKDVQDNTEFTDPDFDEVPPVVDPEPLPEEDPKKDQHGQPPIVNGDVYPQAQSVAADPPALNPDAKPNDLPPLPLEERTGNVDPNVAYQFGSTEPAQGAETPIVEEELLDSGDYYFTFPADGHAPRGFVHIMDTYEGARGQMIKRFGNKWGRQYFSREEAKIDERKLSEVKL